MKTRVISAAVLVPILFLIVLVAPVSAAAAILGMLLAIAAYELLYRTGLVKQPRLVIYSSVMAFAISMWSYFEAARAYFVLLLMAFFMLMLAEMMMDHIKVRFETVSMCFVGGVMIPYFLTALIRILTMNVGRYVILIPFIVAFMNDAGAYFVGLRFGKHKLAPVVSPNKTIEGVFGGLGGAAECGQGAQRHAEGEDAAVDPAAGLRAPTWLTRGGGVGGGHGAPLLGSRGVSGRRL